MQNKQDRDGRFPVRVRAVVVARIAREMERSGLQALALTLTSGSWRVEI